MTFRNSISTIARLWAWAIALGFVTAIPAPAEEAPVPQVREEPITDDDREHWAFRPLAAPELPVVQDPSWVKNSIDRFILAALEEKQLAPTPAADRATLIRRATFDLTGLPPTPEETAAFVADPSSAAWENLLDRLLASPAYGQRWAQHWLDLARFAETDGFEHDLVRPEAWRYRDWVIEALNRDLPFDQFIQLQIAGDQLQPGDQSAAVATGFLLAGPDMPDINLQDERRHNVLNEMTSTVGAVLLGLQIGCAQCHDHKYDPLSQADFYRLRAVFETAELFKPQPLGRVLAEPHDPPRGSYLMVRGDFRRPGPAIEPAFPRVTNPWGDRVLASDGTGGRRVALARWLTRPDHPLTTRVLVNRLWQEHFGRGLVDTSSDFGLMGSPPTHPALLDWLAMELPRREWSLKRMHKLLLSSATYQQASRIDPGASDEEPVRQAWRRLWKLDPHNELVGRMNRRRLDGEAIRDAMLSSADQLSTRRGGPGVMPPLPQELVTTLLAGHWKQSPDEVDHRRRSIYVFARRNLRYPLFEAFDRPDALASCPRRGRSTTAPQALILLNSEFSLAQSRTLAGFLLSHTDGSLEAAIDLGHRRLFSRAATTSELDSARGFILAGAQRLRDEGRSAEQLALPDPLPAGADVWQAASLVDYCLATFNTNEFIYVD